MTLGDMDFDVSTGKLSSDPGPGISEFDFNPPPLRSGMVPRADLLKHLETTKADVVTVIAPAGYGKSALLAQWTRETEVKFAWLTLNRADNDAPRLSLRLASSLARADEASDAYTRVLTAAEYSRPAAPDGDGLISALSLTPSPFALVLDDVHVLRSRQSLGILAELIRQLEGKVRFVIASRSDPKLPLAALRASGRLLELTERDLAMSEAEVANLLTALGTGHGWDVEQVTTMTGGWVGALNLLAAAYGSNEVLQRRFDADSGHRFLSEFIRQEILPQLSRRRRDFLRRMSLVERMNGPLCAAVTGQPGASELLRDMATTTHLVHPIDSQDGWYVINRVLRNALRSELEAEDPAASSDIHARAARWFRANDMPVDAIGHAHRSGDTEDFVSLMEYLIKRRYASGHVADVLLWMDWLQRDVELQEYPDLAAMGALVHILQGNALEAERWLDAAARGQVEAENSSVVWLVRAAATRSGVERMINDVEAALENAPPGSRWLPAILFTKGLALVMSGQTDRAEPCFVESARLGFENESMSSVVAALGHRSLIAIRRHDWELASSLADRAVKAIEDYGQEGYLTSGLALVAAARCARRRNDIASTNTFLARASLVRPRLSAALPGESVQILLEMARAFVELSDVVGARALVREAEEIVLQRPDLGVLPDELQALRESLATLGPGTVGLSALTKAELRLLPYLATNLSFPEIGDQLFVSKHTVKTQAMSIYRKLGTSSRSEAVARAYEVGLLQH